VSSKFPKPATPIWVALSAASAGLFVLIASASTFSNFHLLLSGLNVSPSHLVCWPKWKGRRFCPDPPTRERIRQAYDRSCTSSLHFSSMTYTPGSRTILDNISGSVKPGQVMAIVGASGAGKSTFLDLLARKSKRGNVSGVTLVNGR
jgi:ABC-type multidrug transport system fused ATPase/permease subunit